MVSSVAEQAQPQFNFPGQALLQNSSPQFNNPADFLRLIRSLDIISWALASQYLILLFWGNDLKLTTVPTVAFLPLFALAYGAATLPDKALTCEKWGRICWNLRLNSAITAFTMPFLFFLIGGERNLYLVSCAVVGIFCFIQCLAALAMMSRLAGQQLGNGSLAAESRLAIQLLLLVAVLAVGGVAVSLINPGAIQIGRHFLMALLLIVVFPLVLPVTLIFRVKFNLLKSYRIQKERELYD